MMAYDISFIRRRARQLRLDPNAVIAVGGTEGLHGGVGDHGTSFGPWMLHEGGALPAGKGRAWAESPAGIDYALRRMAQVAGGLSGRQAIAAIVNRFERPANPAGEIAKAGSAYGGSPGVAQALPAASPLGQASAGPGGQPARSALAQNLIAASQASAQGQTPDYSQTFALVAALKSPSAPNAAPIPVFAAPSVAPAKAKQAVQLAQHFLGTAYQWGGSSPKTGFDCSGLLQYVWGQQGVRIPRTSQQQFKAGRPVSLSQLRAGDAVFFHPEGGGPGHVGMMLDRTHFIEAPHTGAVVRISSIQGRGAIGARRYA